MDDNFPFTFSTHFYSTEKLYILSSAILLLSLVAFVVKYINTSHKILPPSPTQLPLIGSIDALRKNKPIFRWIDSLMNEMNTDIICIRFFRTNVVFFTSDVLAKELLKNQDKVFVSRPICLAAEIISGGYLSTIVSPNNEQWNKMKKILISEILSTNRHKWLLNKRDEEADNLLHYVYKQTTGTNGGVVNVRIAARHYCGNVIRKLIFGKRFFGVGAEDGGPGFEEVEHVDAIFKMLEYLYAFCVSDYVGFLRGRVDLDGHEKIVRKAVESVRKYQDPLIDERAQQWENKTRTTCEDLLDVMLSLKSSDGTAVLSIDEIKAQVIDLMIATVDNPSNAAEWAIAEMINQPWMLQRATDELDKFIGRDRLVQESDLPKLNFIKSCAKEAFRLHPIAPFIPPHVSICDTTFAGYFIPKGSHMILSRRGLGRNPKIWDDPLKFNPLRHYKEDNYEVTLTNREHNYVSFSSGRRGCPGVMLGSTITIMLLARLLQGFTWSSPTEEAIDLHEAKEAICMAKPLLALAKPRLCGNLYPRSNNNNVA